MAFKPPKIPGIPPKPPGADRRLGGGITGPRTRGLKASGIDAVCHLDEELLREVASAQSDAIYYIAGPPNMVSSMSQTLAAIGVPSERTRQEMFRGYDKPEKVSM